MAGWSADKYPIKRELKHTLEGGGMIWDVSHRNPSIKVKFDLDGSTRTLRFRNVWWSYGEYDRHMN